MWPLHVGFGLFVSLACTILTAGMLRTALISIRREGKESSKRIASMISEAEKKVLGSLDVLASKNDEAFKVMADRDILLSGINLSHSSRSLEARLADMHSSRLGNVRRMYEDVILHSTSEKYFRKWYLHHEVDTVHDFINDRFSSFVHERKGFVFQTIPKVGCSTWRIFNIKLSGANLTELDHHALGSHGILMSSHIYARGYVEAIKFNNDPSFLRVITVRNPIVRILSAYESKRVMFEFDPFWHRNFNDFVERINRGVLEDEHFKPQIGFGLGAHFDFIARFEYQSEWVPVLFEYLKSTTKNWQELSKDSQIQSAMISRSAVLARYKSDLQRVLSAYSLRSFEIVEKRYQADIAKFGYREEVSAMKALVMIREASLGTNGGLSGESF